MEDFGCRFELLWQFKFGYLVFCCWRASQAACSVSSTGCRASDWLADKWMLVLVGLRDCAPEQFSLVRQGATQHRAQQLRRQACATLPASSAGCPARDGGRWPTALHDPRRRYAGLFDPAPANQYPKTESRSPANALSGRQRRYTYRSRNTPPPDSSNTLPNTSNRRSCKTTSTSSAPFKIVNAQPPNQALAHAPFLALAHHPPETPCPTRNGGK